MIFEAIFKAVLELFGHVFSLLPSDAQMTISDSFIHILGYGVYLLGGNFTAAMLGVSVLEMTGFTTFWIIEYIWKRVWS